MNPEHTERSVGWLVYEVLRPIALAGKHATVKMAGTAITAALEWARIAEFRAEGSPVETVRRRRPKRAGGPKHYDALHFSEVAGALARIDATNCAPSTKRAIRFTALTAARRVEVRRATWEQFDVEAATWVKPAEATKTAKSHRVPLSRQALGVLAEARKGNRGALVFPGTRPGAMMGNVVMTQALRNAGVAASGHGFRSSFKGWARQHDVNELLSESSRWRTWRVRRPSPRTPATTCSRSAARSCRRGPTASRGRGGFRNGHAPLVDSCGVRRVQTMRRPARLDAALDESSVPRCVACEDKPSKGRPQPTGVNERSTAGVLYGMRNRGYGRRAWYEASETGRRRRFFEGQRVAVFHSFARQAARRLVLLDNAETLGDPCRAAEQSAGSTAG